MILGKRLPHYARLLRLDKPIGFFLLLWPTLWALWLAKGAQPDNSILFIFISGALVMRCLGCIVNDWADQSFDRHVSRTAHRPLACRQVSNREAIGLAFFLACLAFILVLQCNMLTILLAIPALGLALLYPFLKRFTHFPQLGLGVAFSFGVPMAFAAETGQVGLSAWLLFLTAMLWPIIYDSLYAMVDREEDIKIGVKSTAIWWGNQERKIILWLQLLFVVLLIINGVVFHLHGLYYACVTVVVMLFLYQQWLIKDREPTRCFEAFLNNNWVGLFIFAGIVSSYLTT